jgi:hypothetical protein
MRTRLPATVLALIALLLAGCDQNLFEITLRLLPDGRVERVLTCWREDSRPEGAVLKSFPPEDLARLAAAYGVDVPAAEARRYEFCGVFAEAPPPDVGGAGRWHTWRSPLGSLCAYAERFRGADDQQARLVRLQTARDEVSGLVRGWLAANLAGHEGWDTLAAFLDGPLRADLANVLLGAWIGQLTSESRPLPGEAAAPALRQATVARLLLYLAEHDYLRPAEFPVWLAFFQDETADAEKARALACLGQVAARKAGLPVDSPVLAALQALLEPVNAHASFAAYLRTTPEWRAAFAAWRAAQPDAPVEDAPDPLQALIGRRLEEIVSVHLFPGRADRLRLHLFLPAAPVATNGRWDAAAGRVEWDEPLPGTVELPLLLHAAAALPEREVQTRCFGRVLLEGEALAGHVLWYNGLAPTAARDWDALVAHLPGQPDPAAAIATFLAPPAEDETAPDPLRPGREALLKALDGGRD